MILQSELPPEMHGARPLPGVAPCAADDWIRVDDAYAAQMAERIRVLKDKREDVFWLDPSALPAAQETLREVLAILPDKGFSIADDVVTCPDGRDVVLDHDAPLETLCHLVQQDICLMQKRGDQHVLTGAILCFPANWRLREKVGHPLTTIHVPVPEYDAEIARRVQRLFDGVRVGRPLWRFNRLEYSEPDLHQPERKRPAGDAPFTRSERQCILRLPQTQAVVFTIHTYVVRNFLAQAQG